MHTCRRMHTGSHSGGGGWGGCPSHTQITGTLEHSSHGEPQIQCLTCWTWNKGRRICWSLRSWAGQKPQTNFLSLVEREHTHTHTSHEFRCDQRTEADEDVERRRVNAHNDTRSWGSETQLLCSGIDRISATDSSRLMTDRTLKNRLGQLQKILEPDSGKKKVAQQAASHDNVSLAFTVLIRLKLAYLFAGSFVCYLTGKSKWSKYSTPHKHSRDVKTCTRKSSEWDICTWEEHLRRNNYYI